MKTFPSIFRGDITHKVTFVLYVFPYVFWKFTKIDLQRPRGGMDFAWKVIKNLLDMDPRGLKEAKKTFKC